MNCEKASCWFFFGEQKDKTKTTDRKNSDILRVEGNNTTATEVENFEANYNCLVLENTT